MSIKGEIQVEMGKVLDDHNACGIRKAADTNHGHVLL
jgi:hypothetical protein